MNIGQYLWEGFKSWRRKETRVAPRDQRGRVYSHKTKVKVTAKVIRKNGDVEIIGDGNDG